MTQPTPSEIYNTRIISEEKIIIPRELVDEKLPLDLETAEFIKKSRKTISDIINLKDSRLMVITWPCSIHNKAEALEYAKKIKKWQKKYPHLFFVMRVYFEKPRTTVWWKWFINDPELNWSNNIDFWLYEGRELLLTINKMWIPCATEFLDPLIPQYIADTISLWAIWARTTESQTHREMASWLSMPVWFKNSTDWRLQIAVDAIKASRSPHSFLWVTKDWLSAKITTTWNPDGHIILRWWKDGSNYSEKDIKKAEKLLEEEEIKTWEIVDFSHNNAEKKEGKEKWEGQMVVCEEVARQIREWNKKIAWVMIESNINAWNQKFIPWSDNPETLKYWVSITDECAPIGWKNWTWKMLWILNSAIWCSDRWDH